MNYEKIIMKRLGVNVNVIDNLCICNLVCINCDNIIKVTQMLAFMNHYKFIPCLEFERYLFNNVNLLFDMNSFFNPIIIINNLSIVYDLIKKCKIIRFLWKIFILHC